MNNIQGQLEQASDAYEKSRWSHGVIDPVVLDEIGDAFFQGAEYGYQLAVDKAVEWLESVMLNDDIYGVGNNIENLKELINDFKKSMNDELQQKSVNKKK